MQNEKLSGIERELVLQYLMDGNVPVTITLADENKDEIHSVSSQIFPVALKAEHFKVNKNGKIYLENPPQIVKGYKNKTVKVEFYFNHVGLFFISELKSEKDSLVLLLPDKIDRIKDEEETIDYDFSAVLYFEYNSKKDINRLCIPWEHETLFSRPVWKSIPLDNQKAAKDYLEKFVEAAKKEKNAGTGIQLIPVCNYLTFKEAEKIKSIENRVLPLNILYVDHERIVLSSDSESDNFETGHEYGLKLSFSIKNSPVLSRDIYVTCLVNKVYSDADNKRKAIDFIYTTLQEEDLRYIFEKATKRLFV